MYANTCLHVCALALTTGAPADLWKCTGLADCAQPSGARDPGTRGGGGGGDDLEGSGSEEDAAEEEAAAAPKGSERKLYKGQILNFGKDYPRWLGPHAALMKAGRLLTGDVKFESRHLKTVRT